MAVKRQLVDDGDDGDIASLWLLPPPGALSTILKTLISNTLPPRIPGPVPDFQPHITISSGIPLTSSTDFQNVLDLITIQEPPVVKFRRIRYGTAFWTKITIEIHKSTSLKSLAVAARSAILPGYTEEEARCWVEKYTTPAESGQEGFIPHLSLVYYGEEVEGSVRLGVGSDVDDAGVVLEEVEGGGDVKEMGGWVGGKLVVVDTTKRVEQWKDSILAERVL
ncbi:hypothetical protein AOL_s00173g325 [Orbilia oligospora ATCC 24927]|uniref:2',3'-cyclic-nucleotide 3'-phosphodiesterase n=1 Tax=Arthrobotrys oligospora (strain ATCC 24927 / CBS 115.81 / DSM 1491) TaxID=756982 RepID=G1XPF7_ARTOA|nr:hypothetical protein AOL_s00173g325 [Orbilia oligospora ATCC 24927]EGX45224.1 hypothetical protein AOL_s00173g325 [Orbilia oligospora ATCC 24927]